MNNSKIYAYIISNFMRFNKSEKWERPHFNKDLIQSEVEEFLSSAKDILNSQKQTVEEIYKVPKLDISNRTAVTHVIKCLQDLPQNTNIFVDYEEGTLYYTKNRKETEEEFLKRNMESFILFVNKKLEAKANADKVREAIATIQDILKEYPEVKEFLAAQK